VTWPAAGLHPLAESARSGLRALDRLEAVAAQGRAVIAGADRRSRLPTRSMRCCAHPMVTPKALASRLKVAPQTATALLRAAGQGLVREVTGRGRFWTFAI
jgi:hypothetical protein